MLRSGFAVVVYVSKGLMRRNICLDSFTLANRNMRPSIDSVGLIGMSSSPSHIGGEALVPASSPTGDGGPQQLVLGMEEGRNIEDTHHSVVIETPENRNPTWYTRVGQKLIPKAPRLHSRTIRILRWIRGPRPRVDLPGM